MTNPLFLDCKVVPDTSEDESEADRRAAANDCGALLGGSCLLLADDNSPATHELDGIEET